VVEGERHRWRGGGWWRRLSGAGGVEASRWRSTSSVNGSQVAHQQERLVERGREGRLAQGGVLRLARCPPSGNSWVAAVGRAASGGRLRRARWAAAVSGRSGRGGRAVSETDWGGWAGARVGFWVT
jgi:hypothetical protein